MEKNLVDERPWFGGEARLEIIKGALGEIGISIFAAAITTAGSSLFLVGASLLPMRTIGIFIAFDIGFSLLVAIFFLPALLRFIGPLKLHG